MAPLDSVVYGHLFRDPGHDCLFARHLGHGLSCITQLVHSYTTGGVCVRKTLRHPIRHDVSGGVRGDGKDRGDGSDRAVREFDREVRMVRLLHAGAADARHELRVPRLLSASSTPGGGRVSHWELCNGGTLSAFLERCDVADAVLPEGLALHVVLQILETLDFMYTGMKSPVYHRDLHTRNMMLHFAPGNPIPDVYLIDFGRAAVVSGPEDQDQDQDGDQDPARPASDDLLWWDIRAVAEIIDKGLAPQTQPPNERGPRHMAALFKRSAGKDYTRPPLAAVRHMLDDLHREFADGVFVALKEQHARRRREKDKDKPPSAAPVVVPLPSLKPVLSFLRRAVKTHLPRRPVPDVAINEKFRTAVLNPARERAVAVSNMRPKLCRRVGDLLRFLEEEGGKGPWDVAEVDGRDPELRVRRVLLGQTEGECSKGWVEDGDEDDDAEKGQVW
jgi:hypothetical protein